MSIELDRPFVVATFEDTSKVLNHLDSRLTTVEQTTATIEKVWKYLKYATPALVTALLAGVSHDSVLYKLGSALIGLLQTGTPPAG